MQLQLPIRHRGILGLQKEDGSNVAVLQCELLDEHGKALPEGIIRIPLDQKDFPFGALVLQTGLLTISID
jgi:hypothetical protein